MWSVAAKNPLEAETVGQRRERKAKESEGSMLSSRSSSSIKAFRESGDSKDFKDFKDFKDTKSLKSNKTGKFSVFGVLNRSSKTPTPPPDLPLKINVTQSFDVAASELRASQDLPSPGSLFVGPHSFSRSYAELSASPSVCRPRVQRSPSFRGADASRNAHHEERRKSLHSGILSISNFESKFESCVNTVEITTPIDRAHSPLAMLERKLSNEERPKVLRNASTMSTCSTLRSEPTSLQKSIPEEVPQHTPRTSTIPPDLKNDIILTALPSPISTPEVHSISLSTPNSPPTKAFTFVPPYSETTQNNERLQAPPEASVASSHRDRLLRIMNTASNRVVSQRLTEDWDGIEFDIGKHIEFEKRLWAVTALKRLEDGLQNDRDRPEIEGEQIDGENSVGLCSTKLKVVNICEIGAESWSLAAANPNFTVHSLSPSSPPDTSKLPWGAPPNLDFQSWSSSPSLSYEDGSIDLISSSSIASQLRSYDWPPFLRECARVLKPTGSLEFSVLDPMPRNAGPLLQNWTTAYLILGLERRFLATRPAMVIPFWLKDVSDLTLPQIKTTAFPAVTIDDTDGADAFNSDLVGVDASQARLSGIHRRRRSDIQQLRTVAGRHFYQSLYRALAPEARPKRPVSPGFEDSHEIIRHWWWQDPTIVRECREYGTIFEMVTYTCRKRDSV